MDPWFYIFGIGIDPTIMLFGFGIGLLVGMTGMGGASLMTPLLILIFGIQPVTAIGTDIAYAAVTKTVGGYKHWTQKTVDLTLSSWMAIGSVPAAIFGVYVLTLLEDWLGSSFEDTVIAILAGALLLTGAATLIRAFLKRMHERERDTIKMERRHKVAAVLLGLSVGFVLGVTSAGSGALIAVGLILLFRLSPQRVHGRVPRRDPPVGGWALPRGGRQCGLRTRGHDPAGLGAGRVDG
jgi:uncharacterized membrane protein YfcA